mgnify:CR=1 FL=1|jgi:hypothetical protein
MALITYHQTLITNHFYSFPYHYELVPATGGYCDVIESE